MVSFMSTYLIVPALADNDVITLNYPAAGTISRPFIEFRARKAVPPHAGHVFVFLGREAADGTTTLYAAGGFYPDTIKDILSGPGHIDYHVSDISTDIEFRVKITANQEHQVLYIVKNWNTKEYNLASQNCTHLIKNIGKSIGLDVGDPKSTEFPYDLVQMMKNENDADRPLRFAITEAKRAQAIRARDAAALAGVVDYMRRHAAEVRQSQAAWDRFQRGAPSGGVGIPMPGSGGVPGGTAPFAPNSLEYDTWPWRPPSP